MTINDVPEVSVDHRYGYKFIVVKLTDGTGGERVVLRVRNHDYKFHREILAELKREVGPSGLTAFCIGGGLYTN